MTVKVIPITDAYRREWTRIFTRGNSSVEEGPHKPRAEGSTPSPATNMEPCTAVINGPVCWVLEEGLDFRVPGQAAP